VKALNQYAHIEANLKGIRARMVAAIEAAGREPDSVTLIAVTKSVGADEIRALRELGLRHFGENRVEVARAKRDALGDPDLVWHMIGNVQRRKTRDVLEVFDRIDAMDRLALAESIQSRCVESDTRAVVLVEVNVSGEEQKLGVSPAELPALLDAVAQLDRIRVRGLMTMAPYGAAATEISGIFARLASLATEHKLTDVSMGMSDDFELAIAAGATEIRVGSALFE
jgi:pyridoxal phosphate enzyme (YggS family)